MSDTPGATVVPEQQAPAPKSRRGRRILGTVLAVLILLLLLATYLLFRLVTPQGGLPGGDAATNGVTWIRSIYGTSQAPEDQFDQTQAAETAPDGTIWVTDSTRLALMRFASDGRFLGEVKGPEDAPLQVPSRIAVGPDGLVYVCETALGAVRVLDQNGNEAGSFGIPSPVSIAVSEDRIAVGTVQGLAILDKEGQPLHVIGSRGQGDDQFDYVHGVAIGEDGTVYAVDSYNNRISAYDRDGKRLWIVRTGQPGNQADMDEGRLTTRDATDLTLPADQRLQLPLGMTIDGAGRLVVVDMFECGFGVFDPTDGSFIAKYGDVGPEDGQFFYPTSVGYDAERDWFTVADNLNNRVQIIRMPGSTQDGAGTAVRRALSGPLRACLFPFLLLLLALIVWAITRRMRARKERDATEKSAASDADEDFVEE